MNNQQQTQPNYNTMESNPSHFGERRVLSSLCHLFSPDVFTVVNAGHKSQLNMTTYDNPAQVVLYCQLLNNSKQLSKTGKKKVMLSDCTLQCQIM